MELILKFFADFLAILSEMAPWLLLGFFFAGVLHAFIPRRSIERNFNGKPLRSAFLASLFGIPLPLCSCGVIPTGAAFYRSGASKGGTISFLISTPQTGVDSILATFSLMGLPFAILRPIAALLTGVSGGLVTAMATTNEKRLNENSPGNEESTNTSIGQKLKDVFRYGFVEFIQDISKWLMIGLLLAALISALVPDEFFSLMELPPLLQMLLILVVSIPLYICATGSIPLAAVLILKGVSPGAAFVLLMAGPATNVATITMISKVLGKRSLFVYLASIIAGALAFGALIDHVLPAAWFTSIVQEHSGHMHEHGPAWWQITSGIMLVLLILNGYYLRYRTRTSRVNMETVAGHNRSIPTASTQQPGQNEAPGMSFQLVDVKTISVKGMTCNHCTSSVEKGLQELEFVDRAQADLVNGNVRIEGSRIDMDAAKKVIEELGYRPL